MLIFIEAGGKILKILPSHAHALAYLYARMLSRRRRWVFVHTPWNRYVFSRGEWLKP